MIKRPGVIPPICRVGAGSCIQGGAASWGRIYRGLDPRLCRYGARYSCEQCQADLAACIDLELDNPAQAAASYPYVWRHLWDCRACAQTYECTHTLLAAERSGWLVSPREVGGMPVEELGTHVL